MKPIIQKLWMFIALLWVSVSVSAYDFKVDGIYYSVISESDMTCEVVKGEKEYSGDIVIPSVVTYNSRQLSVIYIDQAFSGCSSLTTVTIPNSVTSIGDDSFSYCSSLTTVTIPNSVTSIGNSAFNGCRSLTTITIPNSVTSIGDDAFCDCRSLTTVTISNSVTSIGDHTFLGCSSLTSVTIPNSVTSIREGAFGYCTSLTSVTIPNSVTSIGSCAFSECSSLETITLPDSLTSIQNGLFYGCESLESLVLPGSIKQLEQYLKIYDEYYNVSFFDCDKLKSLSILYSSEELSVGYYYFNEEQYVSSSWDSSWTDRIETLFIDRPLEEYIPVPNLKKLELGESIKEVDINISDCKYLESIVSHALVPPELGNVSNAQYMNVNVYVPEEALGVYKADPVWGQFWNFQASGVEDLKAEPNMKVETGRYDINGRSVSDEYDGLVIIRYSDGSCKKLIQK